MKKMIFLLLSVCVLPAMMINASLFGESNNSYKYFLF